MLTTSVLHRKKLISVLMSFSMLVMSVIPAYAVNDALADIADQEIYAEGADPVTPADAASANTASANATIWHRLQYSGKQPVPACGTDGKFYVVKGTMFSGGAGAASSDKKVLKNNKKGLIKVGKSGSATLTSEKYGTIDVTVIDPKISDKKASLTVGGSKQLSVSNVPDGVPVAWTSSDQNVVQVLSGNCTAVGIGKSKVTAYVGGKALNCNITVKDTANATLLYNVSTGGKGTVLKGVKQAKKISFTQASPEGGTASNNTVSGDNASGSASGNQANSSITFNKGRINASEATSYPTYFTGSDGHKFSIYVNNPGIETSVSLKIGEKKFIIPENSHELPVFKSKNNAVASMSEYGVVVGNSAGSTVLTGKYGGKKVKISVTVSDEIYSGSDKASDTAIRNIQIVDPINGNTGYSIDMAPNGDYTVIKDGNRKTVSENNPPKPEEEEDEPENKLCTVDFDSNGGSPVDSQTVTKGETITKPQNPVKAEAIFNGWNYESYLYNFSSAVETDLTLKAEWEDDKNSDGVPDNITNSNEKITVAFDLNDGMVDSALNGETVIKHITKDTDPSGITPQREGFTFIGWFYPDGTQYEPGDTINSDTVLVAHWENNTTGVIEGAKNVYVFINDGFGYVYTEKVSSGSSITPPVLSRPDYRFDHYKYADGTTYRVDDTFTQSTMMYAVWEPLDTKNKGVVVVFNPRNGEEPFKQVIAYNSTVDVPTNPTYHGHTFRCWEYDGAAFSFTTPIRTNIDLYAAYDEYQYTINYDANGAAGTKDSSVVKYTERVVVNGTGFSRPGYEFLGYSTDRNATVATYGRGTFMQKLIDTDGGDITLYAIWKAQPVRYTVIHERMDLNGTSYTEAERQTMTAPTGSTVSPSPKTYTGFTSPARQNAVVEGDGSTTITYQYERNRYNLTVAAGTNVDSVTGSGTYYYGAPVMITANVKANYDDNDWVYNDSNDYRYKGGHTYTFQGWDSGNNTYRGSTTTLNMPANDLTVTGNAIETCAKAHEEYKVIISQGANITSIQPTAGTHWMEKDSSVTVSATYGDAYIAKGTGVYQIDGPKTISILAEPNNVTVNWTAPLSESGQWLDPSNIPIRSTASGNFSDADHVGWKTLRYTDKNGITRYANPYNIDEIEIMPGTAVYMLIVSDADNNYKIVEREITLPVSGTLSTTDDTDGHGISDTNPGMNIGVTDVIDEEHADLTKVTSYKVVHKLMDLNGSTYTTVEEQVIRSLAYREITPDTRIYTGFTAPVNLTTTMVEPDGSTVVTYNYTRNQYNIVLNKGANISSVSGAGRYYYGETVTISANVAGPVTDEDWTVEGGYRYHKKHHYVFDKWSNDAEDTVTTINVGAGDITLTAVGKEDVSALEHVDEEYHLTLTAGVNTKSVSAVENNGWYPDGSSVTISAIPADNDADYTEDNGYRYKKTYLFDKWSDGDTNAERTVVMSEARELTAVGKEGVPVNEEYKVTLTKGSNVTNVTGDGWYSKGSTALLTATIPQNSIENTFTEETGYRYKKTYNYSFDKWSDGDTNKNREITVTAPVDLSASGTETEGKDEEQYKLTVTSDENIKSLTMSTTGQWVNKGINVTVTAVPKDNTTDEGWLYADSNGVTDGKRYHKTHTYSFDKWSDDDRNATRTIVMNAPVSISAIGKYTVGEAGVGYKLNLSKDANIGSVSKSVTADYHAANSKVTITATPKAQTTDQGWTLNGADEDASDYRYHTVHTYAFSKWDDNNITNNREITMDKAYALQAIGTEDTSGKANEQYRLTLDKDNAHIQSITGTSGWKNKGSKVTISASALPTETGYTQEDNNGIQNGYRYRKTHTFTKWSDGVTTNEREITMNEAKTLTAQGEAGATDEQYYFAINAGDNITKVLLQGVTSSNVSEYKKSTGLWTTPTAVSSDIEDTSKIEAWVKKGQSVDYDCVNMDDYTDTDYTYGKKDIVPEEAGGTSENNNGHRWKVRHQFDYAVWN